mgnify:FL=1
MLKPSDRQANSGRGNRYRDKWIAENGGEWKRTRRGEWKWNGSEKAPVVNGKERFRVLEAQDAAVLKKTPSRKKSSAKKSVASKDE